MPQGRNKALPMETREFPDYVYREFPKMLGDKPDAEKDDPTRHIIAENAEHEAELREQYPNLPPFVPPPSSLPMSDFREQMLELKRLRDENARLRLKAGEVDVIDDQKPKPAAPRPVERPDSIPATNAAALAAGEHPAGDPWADQPENQIPEPAAPPLIKPPSIKPAPTNKLKR